MARSARSRSSSVPGSRSAIVMAQVVCAANTTQTPASCSPVPRYASTSSVRSTTSSLLVVVTVIVRMAFLHLHLVRTRCRSCLIPVLSKWDQRVVGVHERAQVGEAGGEVWQGRDAEPGPPDAGTDEGLEVH